MTSYERTIASVGFIRPVGILSENDEDESYNVSPARQKRMSG